MSTDTGGFGGPPHEVQKMRMAQMKAAERRSVRILCLRRANRADDECVRFRRVPIPPDYN